MTLAHYTAHTPQLVQALQALGQRADKQAADILFDELCGITQLVAKKFTNDRTAEGLQEAYRLTIGCLSLAISQADIADSADAKLSFLLQHGAEHVAVRARPPELQAAAVGRELAGLLDPVVPDEEAAVRNAAQRTR